MKGSRRPRTLLSGLTVGLVIALAVYWLRWLGAVGPTVDPLSGLPNGQTRPVVARFNPTPALEAAGASAEVAIEEAIQCLARRQQMETASKPRLPEDGCTWPPSFRRSTSSLPAVLLFGHLASSDLARHVLLNEEDVVLCHPDILELDNLVADYNSAIDALLSAYRNVRVAEKIACIESGVVKPWDPPSEPESQVAARAAVLMVERDIPEAEARAEATKALQSTPMVPSGNYLSHDGRIYLSSDFPALPKTAAVYEDVKFIAGEHTAVLVAWFVQKGLCTDPATPGRILEGLAKSPAR